MGDFHSSYLLLLEYKQGNKLSIFITSISFLFPDFDFSWTLSMTLQGKLIFAHIRQDLGGDESGISFLQRIKLCHFWHHFWSSLPCPKAKATSNFTCHSESSCSIILVKITFFCLFIIPTIKLFFFYFAFCNNKHLFTVDEEMFSAHLPFMRRQAGSNQSWLSPPETDVLKERNWQRK